MVLLFTIFSFIIIWSSDLSLRIHQVDFLMYRYVGAGGNVNNLVVDPYGTGSIWMYSDLLIPFFSLFTFLSPSIWFYMQTAALIALILKLYSQTRHAWIFLLASSTAILADLSAGNLQVLLAFISASPLTIPLACLVKPYCIIFVFAYIARRTVEIHRNSAALPNP